MNFIKLNTFFTIEQAIDDPLLDRRFIDKISENIINADHITKISTIESHSCCCIAYSNGEVRFCKDFKTKEELLNNIMTQLHQQKFTDKLNKIVEE